MPDDLLDTSALVKRYPEIGTAREFAKREILRIVARHDGEWYWYQIDRALSGRSSDCIGPFFVEIRELAAEGLIEIRQYPDEPGGERYWLTDAGKAAVAEGCGA